MSPMTRKIVRALVVGLCVTLAAFGLGQPQVTASGGHRPLASQLAVDPPESAAGRTRVIVQQWDPGNAVPKRVVTELGGTVTRPLEIIDGFAATLPAGAAEELAALPEVRSVTPDTRVRVQFEGPDSTRAAAGRSVYRDTVGADRMGALGYNGNGVVVALIDTGVADVTDLAGRTVEVSGGLLGRDRRCVDLSGEGHCDDSYGHGTFMAGLIAGSGHASHGAHTGVAPGAKILSVKIAGRDGAADVSGVLAAIQWVVSYKDTYDIRVLNLSLGTDSTNSYRTDPFNQAVQRAWDAGIAVVVAASNRGPEPGTIGKPGDDPMVMTVGAIDDQGTATPDDDRLPDFSSRGPTAGDGLPKPDLVAPGAWVTSLRSPGSLIDSETGGGDDYVRGSGTSMAAAVVSGVAALTLAAAPSMTPDRVKFALTETAVQVASTDRNAVGAGVPAPAAALEAPEGTANQGVERAGGGDLTDPAALDLSRGSVKVEVIPSELANGAHSAAQLLAEPLRLTGLWTPEAWTRMAWHMNRLLAVRWSGTQWRGKNWQGASFYGQHETTPAYGETITGSVWYGAFRK
jgi:subtilisin family serine protease